jgi:type IV pilus assembly protein PilV
MGVDDMKTQRGFSLLEVLVTLVIVSLGLLGISALIGNSLKYNQSAYARTQATWFANQIIDEMRANRTTAAGATSSPYAVAAGSTAAPSGAPADLQAWFIELRAALPSGNAGIVYDSATKLFTVTVGWDDSSRLSSDSTVAGSGSVEIQSRL